MTQDSPHANFQQVVALAALALLTSCTLWLSLPWTCQEAVELHRQAARNWLVGLVSQVLIPFVCTFMKQELLEQNLRTMS